MEKWLDQDTGVRGALSCLEGIHMSGITLAGLLATSWETVKAKLSSDWSLSQRKESPRRKFRVQVQTCPQGCFTARSHIMAGSIPIQRVKADWEEMETVPENPVLTT